MRYSIPLAGLQAVARLRNTSYMFLDFQGTTDLRAESVKDMLGDEISNALNSLAVDFRTVIILCDLEGFTYEEMAKILDIPIGTVRSRLHRARNLLKEKLKGYAQHMGYNTDEEE